MADPTPVGVSAEAVATARGRMPAALWDALSHREQNFVAALLADPKMRASEAAKASGLSPKSPDSAGAKMLSRKHVKAAIAAAQTARRERTEIDADWVITEAVGTYQDARASSQFGAATTTLSLIAKMQGLLTDRIRIDGALNVQQMSDEELAKLAAGTVK